MHLKNFSLYEPIDGTMRLTPAYDMLNAVILNPKDDEELALTLNGKKRKLKRSDFITSGVVMGVEQKTIERFIQKYVKLLPKTKEIIDQYDLKFLDDVGTTEDLDFAYRYLKHCKSVYYNPNIRTYHYYQRDGAATNSGFSIKKINSMNTYKKIISDKNNTKLTKKLAQSELCNLSINLILMYKNNNLSNPEILAHLKRTLKDNLGSLLTSHHSMSRKLQGIITCICPNILVKLKNIKHGG